MRWFLVAFLLFPSYQGLCVHASNQGIHLCAGHETVNCTHKKSSPTKCADASQTCQCHATSCVDTPPWQLDNTSKSAPSAISEDATTFGVFSKPSDHKQLRFRGHTPLVQPIQKYLILII